MVLGKRERLKTFTETEMRQKLAKDILNGSADMQTDNHGQIIVYAQVFRWRDGTIREGIDPIWEET